MEHTKGTSGGGARNKSAIFSRNSKITELFELCIEPKTDKEMGSILLRFWEVFDSFPRDYFNFCDIDIASMFVLDYAYKNKSISLSSMTRSLFAYNNHINCPFLGTPELRESLYGNYFLEQLRGISNIYSDEAFKSLMLDSSIESICDDNMGRALFLIKFGIMEFPPQDELKVKEAVCNLVSKFNNYMFTTDLGRKVKSDELIDSMRKSEFKITRALLVLCAVTISASYYLNDKEDSDLYSREEKQKCFRMLQCLELVTSTTTETKIIYRDIENFIAKILSALVNREICNRVMETSQKLFNASDFHNPRSLKDLTRCKIRTSLQKQRMFPEQVDQLMIGDALNDYLLFHRNGIWELLVQYFDFVNLTKDTFEGFGCYE